MVKSFLQQFFNLPIELKRSILQYFSSQEKCNIRLMCKEFSELILDEQEVIYIPSDVNYEEIIKTLPSFTQAKEVHWKNFSAVNNDGFNNILQYIGKSLNQRLKYISLIGSQGEIEGLYLSFEAHITIETATIIANNCQHIRTLKLKQVVLGEGVLGCIIKASAQLQVLSLCNLQIYGKDGFYYNLRDQDIEGILECYLNSLVLRDERTTYTSENFLYSDGYLSLHENNSLDITSELFNSLSMSKCVIHLKFFELSGLDSAVGGRSLDEGCLVEFFKSAINLQNVCLNNIFIGKDILNALPSGLEQIECNTIKDTDNEGLISLIARAKNLQVINVSKIGHSYSMNNINFDKITKLKFLKLGGGYPKISMLKFTTLLHNCKCLAHATLCIDNSEKLDIHTILESSSLEIANLCVVSGKETTDIRYNRNDHQNKSPVPTELTQLSCESNRSAQLL